MTKPAGTPVSSLRNLGAAMSAAFAAVGIPDAETLHSVGADAAYARLIANGSRPHFIAYLAVAMGLQGRGWNDADATEKAALRARFDAIKAARPAPGDAGHAKGRTRLDAALAEIGVIEAPRQPTSSRPAKK